MPKRYAREFRRTVCERLVAGEKVRSLSEELRVSEPTLYLWKRQALIDDGRAEGIKSFEADELAQAHCMMERISFLLTTMFCSRMRAALMRSIP